MADRPRIDLNNAAFRDRLRQPSYASIPPRGGRSFRQPTPAPYVRRNGPPAERAISDIAITTEAPPLAQPAAVPPPPPPPPPPPSPRPQPPEVVSQRPIAATQSRRFHYSRPQLTLAAMAALVFVIGIAASLQTLFTNRATTAQVSALSRNKTDDSDVPSTTKPSPQAVGQYQVAADLARYLVIPKLGVHARVLQVGIKTDGALGTPNNVFDTAWYTGSAKPGTPGATLIDGHVSSWTTHGVFYSIKDLSTGDRLQIIRGDGTTLNYQVVRSQVYAADSVDMQAALTPVTAGKSGLNLITCTGQVKPGTSEFDQRVVVFAEQI